MQGFTRIEYEQAPLKVLQAAEQGPVYIQDETGATYVLMPIRRPLNRPPNIVDMLYMPGMEDIEFDPPRMGSHGW